MPLIAPVNTKLLGRGLKEDWTEIKMEISQILNRHLGTAGYVTSIYLFRYGDSFIHINPNTVHISVEQECPETEWPPVIEKIKCLVTRPQFKYIRLHVHMEYDTVEKPSTRYWSRNTVLYQTKAHLGADISVVIPDAADPSDADHPQQPPAP
ncbi:hypothetical protein B0T14DRAFT_588898 [Immersiella caudata]|uniref:Uncharacterized protein n=1 Tax=Immersiella caudata TaxID=314043 RepID=A0AA39WJX7_9PEZI|nr:hypothetical protein B0T14DRAFT_588898 [Immersiella caudata]